MIRKLFFLIIASSFSLSLFSQEEKEEGQFHGNFEINMQSYSQDSAIGAPAVDEKVRANAYANFSYTKGNFKAGVRYEAYLNTLLGYDERYDGQGVAYRYASYKNKELEFTVGNFYEQFGNGLILRAYEDKNLGYDNAFDGVKLKYKPVEGITLTGILGKQKKYFELGEGIVRGADADISVNEVFSALSESKTRLTLGASFVSKFEENTDPLFNFPENVAAFSSRFTLSRNGFNLSSEFAYKANDPSSDNNLIFKDGNALFISSSWSKKGIGIVVSALRLDNMSFRSERTAKINDLNINYLPAISKVHTYSLAAMYPFSTQPNGQVGINAELFYKIKNKTFLGGKYGTQLSLNFSQVNSIDKQKIIPNPVDQIPNLDGYTSDFFAIGNELYLRDANIEIQKKISRKFKFTAIYMNETYNKFVIQGKGETIHANIGIFDFTYKLSPKNALRLENQIIIVDKDDAGIKKDYGDWYMILAELTFSPHWFISVYDQYNYGNPDSDHKVHYFNMGAGYTKGTNRIQFGYGKQREGIMCVGGVCRNVPASNGFSMTVTSTF